MFQALEDHSGETSSLSPYTLVLSLFSIFFLLLAQEERKNLQSQFNISEKSPKSFSTWVSSTSFFYYELTNLYR
jgi:hypothetical protein